MLTLNLKMKFAGYYQLKKGSITVTVENPSISVSFPNSSNMWQLTVTDRESEEFTLLDDWFKTKKEAVKFGTEWASDILYEFPNLGKNEHPEVEELE